jgi:hypothetical protein
VGYDFVDTKVKENNRKVHNETSGAYPLYRNLGLGLFVSEK